MTRLKSGDNGRVEQIKRTAVERRHWAPFEKEENVSGKIVTVSEDDQIVQLVSSGVTPTDDGTVEVHLCAEEEAWTPETGLRLTVDDALALEATLREAVELVEVPGPQRFIRLLIHERGD